MVQIQLTKGARKLTVTGKSIGGGNIQISEVNGFKLSLSLGTPTYIIVHQDVPGMIARVTNILSNKNVNIGTMTVTRESKGEKAIMIIEVDERNETAIEEIRELEKIDNVSYFG